MASTASRLRVPTAVGPLVETARAHERAGEYGKARDRYERALHRLSLPAHAPAAATLFRWVGDTHRHGGDGEAARDCYEASRAVAELNDDRSNLAHVLNNLGILEWTWGRLDEAERLFLESRELAHATGEMHLAAMVDQNTGVLANMRGDLRLALRRYQESLAAYRALGERERMAGLLSNIGLLHTDLGEWDAAEAMFRESAALCEETGDPITRVNVEVNRTELCLQKGDIEGARAHCDAAYELAVRIQYHLGLGDVYKNYGVIYRREGRLDLAEKHLKKAAEMAERYTEPLLAGEAQRELADVYRLLDRNSEALQALNYAHRVFTDLQAEPDVADVDKRIRELERMYLEVVRRWGESIESKDRYTAGHCERVANYSCMLAKELGFDERTLTWFRIGAFLHDVGKMAVPAEILNKADRLTEHEWAVMRRHTLAGIDLLADMEFPWDPRPMIRSHHERWDGAGYPDGLAGRQIPLSARILCIADVFDALTSTRAYRPAYSPEQALEIMRNDAGTIFDPELLALFERLIRARIEAGAQIAGG